jgi:hypothetical protein
MAEEDLRVRAELAADGSLFQGYHPRMQAVLAWSDPDGGARVPDPVPRHPPVLGAAELATRDS